MNWLAAGLLGVVQGLTEFLPVSSSAHLLLARAFFGIDVEHTFGTAFDVACHLGTLLAVVLFFRTDVVALIQALPRAVGRAPGPEGRRLRLMVVGTIPVVIVGGLFAKTIEAYARTPAVAATTLLVGGLAFLVIERVGTRAKGEGELSPAGAFVIGIAQSAALVPGVSRSGATIATGMALGLHRPAAARFTFLLSIPAIIAAAAKEGLDLRHEALTSHDFALFAVGTVASATVGYATIKFFLRYLSGHRLDAFAWYRIALAVVTFIWLARQ